MFPASTPRVLACSCADVSPDLKFRHADAVFTGKAIARKDLKAGAKLRSGIDPIAWTFDVERVFKGNVAKQQSVLSAAMGASCGIQFKVGDRYQVYAKRQGSTLSTHLCSGTKPLAADIRDLLAGVGFGKEMGNERRIESVSQRNVQEVKIEWNLP